MVGCALSRPQRIWRHAIPRVSAFFMADERNWPPHTSATTAADARTALPWPHCRRLDKLEGTPYVLSKFSPRCHSLRSCTFFILPQDGEGTNSCPDLHPFQKAQIRKWKTVSVPNCGCQIILQDSQQAFLVRLLLPGLRRPGAVRRRLFRSLFDLPLAPLVAAALSAPPQRWLPRDRSGSN